jgi:hypothetical protein
MSTTFLLHMVDNTPERTVQAQSIDVYVLGNNSMVQPKVREGRDNASTGNNSSTFIGANNTTSSAINTTSPATAKSPLPVNPGAGYVTMNGFSQHSSTLEMPRDLTDLVDSKSVIQIVIANVRNAKLFAFSPKSRAFIDLTTTTRTRREALQTRPH